MKKLPIFLVMTVCMLCGQKSYSQIQQGKMGIDQKLYEQMMHRLADCNTQSLEFKKLIIDTANLHELVRAKDFEINRKEDVILEVRKARTAYKAIADSTQQVANLQNAIIYSKDKELQKSKKRLGLGLYAGYGLMGMSMMGTSIGIGFSYHLFNF